VTIRRRIWAGPLPCIATRHPDARDGEAWRNAFDSARGQRQLTLNQACRVVLGPVYVPERQVHAYNANHELRVRASDLAPWLPELEGEGDYEYSLSELYGLATSEASNDTTRPDSNRIALASIRALLGVRGSFDVTVHDTPVHVEVTASDAARWPRVVEGLDEGTDGPWPAPLYLTCIAAGIAPPSSLAHASADMISQRTSSSVRSWAAASGCSLRWRRSACSTATAGRHQPSSHLPRCAC